MRILLLGDTHGDKDFIRRAFQRAEDLEADIIFQLGDYGYGWKVTQFKGTGGYVECEYAHFTSDLVAKHGVPFYWLDGNHENFDWLETFQEDFPGAHLSDGTWLVAPGVHYVPRGTVMEFDGVLFLCCGGAISIDKKNRTNFVSWWQQESIKESDIQRCIDSGPVDVLLSHDFPIEVTVIDRHLDPYWGEEAQRTTINNRTAISTILEACGAKYMFHGHLHLNYEEKIRLGENFVPTVTVRGLDCNMSSVEEATLLIDTDDYKNHT